MRKLNPALKELWRIFSTVYGLVIAGVSLFFVFFTDFKADFYKFGYVGILHLVLVIPISMSWLVVALQRFLSKRRWPTLWQIIGLIPVLVVLAVSVSFVFDATLRYTELVVISDKDLMRVKFIAKSDPCWFLAFPCPKGDKVYSLRSESSDMASEMDLRTYSLPEQVHYGDYEIHLDYRVGAENRFQVLYRHFHTKRDTLLW